MKRNPDGTFAKGNRGGPGRPSRQTEAHYLKAMADVCDEATWQAITQRAVDDALAGDAKAREWLAGYLLGQPGPCHFAPSLARADAESQMMAAQEFDPVENEKAALRQQQAPPVPPPAPARRCDGKVLWGQSMETCDRPAIHVWRDAEHEHHFCDLHYHYHMHGRLPPLDGEEPAAR